MAAPARVWQHPRWSYDETSSPAARRAAARMAIRSGAAASSQTVATAAAVADPRPTFRPASAPAPRLRAVRRPRVRLFPALVVLVMAGAALLGPTALNLASMRAEWRTAHLEQQRDDMLAQRAALQARVSALSSTQRIEEAARRLGMVKPTAVDLPCAAGCRQRGVGALGQCAGEFRPSGAPGGQGGGPADGR
ncbi:MAG: septum formation initiator family protein [Thermoleophilia bacterium]|nr:septum formation initiator family protein [Thermoleophilia bacterium]